MIILSKELKERKVKLSDGKEFTVYREDDIPLICKAKPTLEESKHRPYGRREVQV